MRRFTLSTGKGPRETSVSGHVRPGFHPHSLRRLSDAVLVAVRSCRRCCLCVGLPGPAAESQSPRTLGPRCSFAEASFRHALRTRRTQLVLLTADRSTHPAVAGGANTDAAGSGGCACVIPYNGSKSMSCFHNTCNRIANLRATATTALRFAVLPPRAANPRSQRRRRASVPKPVTRERTALPRPRVSSFHLCGARWRRCGGPGHQQSSESLGADLGPGRITSAARLSSDSIGS